MRTLQLVISLLFVTSLYAGTVEQGQHCTQNSECIGGLACVNTGIIHIEGPGAEKWGGITYKSMYQMLLRNEGFYQSSWTEDDLYEFTKYISGQKVIKKAATYTRSSEGTESSFPVYKKKNGGHYDEIERSEFATDDTRYRVYGKNYYSKYKVKEGMKQGMEVRHILGFYARQAVKYNGTNYTYLNFLANYISSHVDNTCGTSDECTLKTEIADDIMDEILEHLTSYREHLEELWPDVGGGKPLITSQGAYILNLMKDAQSAPGPEYCYTFVMDANGHCKAKSSTKVCSCAMEGDIPDSDSGQACCQREDSSAVFATLPIIQDPDNDNRCTSFYIPADPYGPGDGSTADYTIQLKGDVDSTAEGVDKCAFVTTFSTQNDRLEEVGLDVTDNATKIISLQTYINNDWLLALALEYLFSTPSYDDCLIPNFKGRGGDSDPSGETFSALMQTYVGTPLQLARTYGNSIYTSLVASSQSAAEAAQMGSYSLQMAFGDAVDKEKKMLSFENAILYGVSGIERALSDEETAAAAGGLNKILDCCGGKTVKNLDENEIQDNVTWFEALREGYHNIKFKRKWARKDLDFEKGERKPHKFSCRGGNKKGKKAYAWRIKAKIAGKNPIFIDPPLPDIVGKDVGYKWGSYGRKFKRNEKYGDAVEAFKDALTEKIPNYFTELSQTDESGQQSFLPSQNKRLLVDAIGEYAYHIAAAYSKKTEWGRRTSRKKHMVPSRDDTFYPQMENVIEELGYYFNQLATARAARIACLGGELDPDGGGGNGSGYGGDADTHIVDPNQDKSIDNDVNSEDQAATDRDLALGESNTSTDIDSSSTTIDLGSDTTTTDSGSSTSQDNSTDGGNVNDNDSYNAAAAKRAQRRENIRNKILKKLNSSDKKKLLAASKVKFSKKQQQNVNNIFNSGFSKSNSSAARKSYASKKQATAKKADDSKTKKGSGDDDDDWGLGAIASSEAFEDGSKSSGSGAITEADAQAEMMLDALDQNSRKYQDKDSDSLFEKVTKAYFRSGYKRILGRRKKDSNGM